MSVHQQHLFNSTKEMVMKKCIEKNVEKQIQVGNSKITIKKPIRQNVLSQQAETRSLNIIKCAIHSVFSRRESTLSYEELYRVGYHLILSKCGEKLHSLLSDEIKYHLKEIVHNRIAKTDDDAVMVKELCSSWENYISSVRVIASILLYMDLNYSSLAKKKSIVDTGYDLFCNEIIYSEQVRARLLQYMLQSVHKERMDELSHSHDLIRRVISMLIELEPKKLTVYQNVFEIPFLNDTQAFYSNECSSSLDNNTCKAYLVKCNHRINEEMERANKLFHSTSIPKIQKVVEYEWIERRADAIVNKESSGVPNMIQSDRIDDLKLIFDTFTKVPKTYDSICDAMIKQFKEDAALILSKSPNSEENNNNGNNNSNSPKQNEDKHDTETSTILKKSEQQNEDFSPSLFIQQTLDIKDKYQAIIDTSFQKHKFFHKNMHEAFEIFFNSESKCPQYLAIYADELLKGKMKVDSQQNFGETSSKSLKDDDHMEEVVGKIVMLFRFLKDKDVFESYYKSHLAHRLLNGKSSSSEAETCMISKLKSECGYHFTSKIESMFNDIKMSSEMMKKYESNKETDGIELDVTVLTAGSWPISLHAPITLPQQLLSIADTFKSFYLSNHTGRKLTWQLNLGKAEIRAKFPSQVVDLTVSTYQMIILFLFNQNTSLKYSQIAELTGIPDQDLKRHLLSMAVPKSKYQILIKEPKGKIIRPDDTFAFNNDFTSKLRKLKIPLLSEKENFDGPNGNKINTSDPFMVMNRDSTLVPEAVEEERKQLIDAAIVRTMKARKRLDHLQLITETTKQVTHRFEPSAQQIKKRIESLLVSYRCLFPFLSLN